MNVDLVWWAIPAHGRGTSPRPLRLKLESAASRAGHYQLRPAPERAYGGHAWSRTRDLVIISDPVSIRYAQFHGARALIFPSVGDRGFGPRTSSLSVTRSNQLS
jgi:hypothetical protein